MQFVVPGGLILANTSFLFIDVPWLRLAAGLLLLFVLPGLVWSQAAAWFGTRYGTERILLVGGLSIALSGAALLAAVYLPGSWSLTQTVVSLDLLILAGIAVFLWRRRKLATTGYPAAEPAGLVWPEPKVLLALLLVLAVAVILRWANLGYGEFHEDALENMRLAVRAMKGEEFAPFLDSKGPVHWLLPGALWLMNGWVNEAIARAPFAFSSTLTVLALFVLGRRVANSTVGLIAAALAAVNGFFVAFSRQVENRSLLILLGVMALWCTYRFCKERNDKGPVPGWLLLLGAFLLGMSLVTHPNGILYLPPVAAMVILSLGSKTGSRWAAASQLCRQRWKSILGAILLFLLLILVFYVPFVLDPNFQRTLEYFVGERIGTELLYNRVSNLLEQDRNYSTRFNAPFLIIFSFVVFFRELSRWKRFALPAGVLLLALMSTTLLWPGLWIWGSRNVAFLPYATFFLLLILSPAASFEIKSLILWFATIFLAMEFLAKDAADHIQIAYPAWFLLAAIGFVFFWKQLTGPRGRVARVATGLALGAAASLILFYLQTEFLGSVAHYYRAEADAKYNPKSIYRVLYGGEGLPRPRKLHGNPRLGGWKVVGALYDSGELQGDFRSIKESFAVPIWYTYQTPRSCFVDPQNYFVANTARGLPEEVEQLPANGYNLTRVVLVDQEPRLYLYEKGVPAPEHLTEYQLDDYIVSFDRSATVEHYVQGKLPQYPLDITFGDRLRLTGYDLSINRLAPGDTLAVTLYWQAIAPMDIRYRAFVHVEGEQMWGQHDDDPICRLRTDEWRPSQAGSGQFRVRLAPETPSGAYPVTVGVYNPDNWERLEATNHKGEIFGSAVELTTITVEPK